MPGKNKRKREARALHKAELAKAERATDLAARMEQADKRAIAIVKAKTENYSLLINSEQEAKVIGVSGHRPTTSSDVKKQYLQSEVGGNKRVSGNKRIVE